MFVSYVYNYNRDMKDVISNKSYQTNKNGPQKSKRRPSSKRCACLYLQVYGFFGLRMMISNNRYTFCS